LGKGPRRIRRSPDQRAAHRMDHVYEGAQRGRDLAMPGILQV
jgi:hypothetical protein